jgi:radical SAM superfamily enzyme YgiQ (UPF0313 family)
MYEHPFHLSPIREIEEDLQEVASYHSRAERVHLVGANPFALSFNRLRDLAEMIHKYLPRVTSIGGFGRVTDITPKTDEELKELRSMGYGGIIIGTESGDNATLDFMNKGFKTKDTLEQLHRLEKAGISYDINHMNGLAGAGKGKFHALASTKLYNQLHPRIINITELSINEGSELRKEVQAGNFQNPDLTERLEEQITFVENLSTSAIVYFFPDNPNGAIMVALFPRDKEKVINNLQNALTRVKKK